MKVIYTVLSMAFNILWFLYFGHAVGGRLTELDTTVSHQITGLTDCHLGTLKFFVSSLNVLKKNRINTFYIFMTHCTVQAHIQFDFIWKNTNILLTEREGRTGEYWPEVVAVRTERSEVRTKMTEGQ